MSQSLRKIHYAWIVLVAIMAMNAVSSGLRLSFGIYIDPLVDRFGWSRGGISFAYTLQFLAAIPVILSTGWLVERIGSRRLLLLGGFLITLGMVLTSTITQLWQFQLYYGVITGGLGTAFFLVLLPVMVTRWFTRRVGLAMGLMWTSLSWGPAVMGPLLRWFITAAGWQQTFIIVGVASGLVWFVGTLLLRNKPEDMGLTPYGGLPNDTSKPEAARVTNPNTVAIRPMSAITTTPSFWALVAVHTLGCIGHSVPLAHVVSMASFAGVPALAAAGTLTALSLSSLVSRFGVSMISEVWGGKWTLTLVMFLQTAPLLLLLVAKDTWSFYIFAALFGLGYGGEMVGFPIFNRQYYGYNAPLSTIYSYQMAGALVGMAVGGWLGGGLFDYTGTYTWAILTAIITSTLGAVAALTLPRYTARPNHYSQTL